MLGLMEGKCGTVRVDAHSVPESPHTIRFGASHPAPSLSSFTDREGARYECLWSHGPQCTTRQGSRIFF